MPDLILLCAGAAADRAPAEARSPIGREAASVARALAHGGFARAFGRGALLEEREDASALPRTLPEEAWLHARFGVPAGDSIEAWAAAAFDVRTPAWHATPVNVQVGHFQLLLDEPTQMQLASEEAQALGEAVSDLFAEAGLELVIPSPMHWFLRGRPDWNLVTRSWTMAVGRSIDGYLPSGASAREWRRLFNDAQITWHDHPVNLARQARGQRPVNALWLDGIASAALPGVRGTVFTRDPGISGLARACGCQLIETGPDMIAAATMSQACAEGDVIIDVDFWRAARRRSDPGEWHDAWLRFDRWLDAAGLARGVPAGIDRIHAVLGGERRCVELGLKRSHRWQFWRRFDPLAAAFAA